MHLVNNKILSCRNINFKFNKNLSFCIADLNIDIYKGDFIHLIGPNGSGKTTIMKILNGFLKCSTGVVEIGGKNISKIDSIKRSNIISIIPQQFYTFANFSIEQILSMSHINRNKNFSLDKKELYEIFDIKSILKKHFNKLSAGEKQKIIFTMVIMQETEIIFIDEAWSFIDVDSKYKIINFLKTLNNNGKTILFTSHDNDSYKNYCNRIININNGKIIYDIKNGDF